MLYKWVVQLDGENVVMTQMCLATSVTSTGWRNIDSMCELSPKELTKLSLSWSQEIKIKAGHLTWSESIELKLYGYELNVKSSLWDLESLWFAANLATNMMIVIFAWMACRIGIKTRSHGTSPTLTLLYDQLWPITIKYIKHL